VPAADVTFIHAPAVYDFRQRSILYAPTSADALSTPAGEHYPDYLPQLGEYLERYNLTTNIVNLASLMLNKLGFIPEQLLARLEGHLFVIDLERLDGCQGALEVARILKSLQPRTRLAFIGRCASYYYKELVAMLPVDFVFRGDSLEEPLRRLAEKIMLSERSWSDIGDLSDIPNLSWKDKSGRIEHNPLDFAAGDLDSLNFGSSYLNNLLARQRQSAALAPYVGWPQVGFNEVRLCRGCNLNCRTCAHSYTAQYRYLGRRRNAWPTPDLLTQELQPSSRTSARGLRLLGDPNQAGEAYTRFLFKDLARIKPEQLSLQLRELPADPERFFHHLGSDFPHWTLSLDVVTADEDLRRDFGKDYSDEQLSAVVEAACQAGCQRVDLGFRLGIPGQDPKEIMACLEWMQTLSEQNLEAPAKHGAHRDNARSTAGTAGSGGLSGFRTRLFPQMRVIAPFLPAGSIAFDHPERFGYRLRAHTLEDHCRRLLLPSWKYALNYESDLLSVDELVENSYRLAMEFNRFCSENGALTSELAEVANVRLRAAREQSRRLDAIVREYRGTSAQISRERAAAVNALKPELDEAAGFKDAPAALSLAYALAAGTSVASPLQGAGQRLSKETKLLRLRFGALTGKRADSAQQGRGEAAHPQQQHDPHYLSPPKPR
jgi:hypothetical protein